MAVVKGDRTIVRKNSTGSDFRGRRVNFIEGSNVTLTVAADTSNNEVDVTIASSGGSGTPTFNMGPAASGKVAYWVNASTISFASGLAWDSSNTRLGVGVSTPVALLDLAGTDGSANGTAAGVKITNLETGGSSWFIRTGATGTNTPAGGLSFSNNSNYWLTFDSAGKVALGPGGTNEQATVNGRLAIAFTTGVSNSSGYGKVVVNPSDNLLHYITPTGVDYAWNTQNGNVSGTGVANKLSFWTNASLLSTASFLHYDSANNRLGIGNATPGYQLHVGNNGAAFPVVFGSAPTTTGSMVWMPNSGAPYFGIFDAGNGNVYGISSSLPAPQTPLPSSTIGGYYAGMGIGGKTNQGDGQPIFGVLAANQSLNGPGAIAFTVYDTNRIADYHSNYNNGSGQMGLGIAATAVINERLMVNGRIGIGYTTGASGASGFGKIYMKPSDNLLYFQTPAGVEYDLTATGAGGSGAVGGSGVANKMAFWTNASMLSGASMVDYQPSTGVLNVTKLVRGFASTPTSTATWAVDFNTGSIQYTMLSATTVTVWLQNPVTGGEYTLITRQDGTGSRFLNWPANVVWAGGTTPTPTSSPTYVDMFKLIYNSTASVYWAVPTMNFAR